MTPWVGDQPFARPLPTHSTVQTQNKRTQTSMPRVGLEPRTQVFERAKTVHASDRAANLGPSLLLILLGYMHEIQAFLDFRLKGDSHFLIF
jgi:hypothetical protein